MVITRSMSKKSHETENKRKSPVFGEDEAEKKWKSPFSERATSYIPSWAKPPPPGEKRRPRLMPISVLDPRNSANKGPKWKQELFLKQFNHSVDRMKENDKLGLKPVVVDVNDVPVKVTPAMCIRHSTESRVRVLKSIGIFRGSTHPRESKEYAWAQTLTTVLEILHKVCKIPQREIISMLCLSKLMHDNLISCMSFWKALDFSGMNNVGDRLIAALSMPRYHYVVNYLNLDNAKDIEDQHFMLIRSKFIAGESLQFIKTLNLDGCRNISNIGVKEITHTCPAITKFSICGNSRITDFGIKTLVKNCTILTDLNLSDCKNITDESLVAIGSNDPDVESLESLDITRCERVTDAGVIAVVVGCPLLKSLSLFGITGITDKCLETISQNCSDTLTTLDVNNCIGIKRRSQKKLLKLFPNLRCFNTIPR